MSGKKTIEIHFGADKKPIFTSHGVTTKPKKTVKQHNFNGFVIEVSEAKDKKPARVEDKDNADDNAPVNPPPLKPAPVNTVAYAQPPTGALPKPPRQAVIANGGNSSPRRDNSAKKNEPKVEPPPVTEADWEIFKQFMTVDQVPQVPFNRKQILLGKNYVVTNQEDFVCPICEKFIVKRRGIELKRCVHNFCSPCLVKHIKDNHDEMLHVKCPFPIYPCESPLEDEEVKDLLGEDYGRLVLNVMQLIDANIREKQRLKQIANGTLPDLVQAVDLDYIENFEAFECPICFDDVEKGEGLILKNCMHKFCKNCLTMSVQHSEDFEVKCPGIDPNCKEFLTEREIRSLVSKEVFNKHLEKSLKFYEGTHAQGVTHCKTPDCPSFVEHGPNLRGFMCQICSAVNCIGCKTIHKGMNCDQYQDKVNPDGKRKRQDAESEDAIRKMVANGEAMYCPRCGIPVMKNDGCDFITCTTCKLGICWVTKKPRMPITLVDGRFVDGCHCREFGGKMCDPKCKFCH